MKVILLAPLPPPAGGIAGWAQRMMHTRLKNGWSVTVVDEKLIGGREAFGKTRRSITNEWKRCRSIWKRLKEALRDPETCVVHSCIPATTTGMLREYFCAKITKKAGKKFIIHFRCTIPNMVHGGVGMFMFRRLCRQSDLVMVLNAQSQRFAEQNTETRTVIIPNYIEAGAITDKKEVRDTVETVLYVGGAVREKGCLDIIGAARELPGITFRIVGNPSDEVQKAAQGAKNVVLTGEMGKSEVMEEMRRADLFVFPSYYFGEGFSNALCEAMAQGLPCIVTDHAANCDMIGTLGGKTVSRESPHEIAEAIKAMSDREVRSEMSIYNIEKVRNCYIDTVVTDMYVDAYESL